MSPDTRGVFLFLTLLVGTLLVLASPVLVFWTRRGPFERKRRVFRTCLLASLAMLIWLDGVIVMLAFNVEDGGWWSGHLWSAAFLSLVLLGVAPYRSSELRRLALGLGGIWSLALILPYIPWDEDKIAAQDAWKILGQPVAKVQEVMASYEVTAWLENGERRDADHVSDLDLAALAPVELHLYPGLGGFSVVFENGRVARVGFNYD